ncbi:MAG: amidohydrolase, partial [Betaproteobacteria bacterium]|nr:amidohydrolase [Betaproteobacteria bacterium]
IEDALLPPLEKMLAQYPKAKVIWCHLAQVSYIERAPSYSPAYVEGLIGKFPNLYFDTAFGGSNSVYPLSGQRHARVWADNGGLRKDWLDLLVAYPQRFLAALDLGGDRMHRIREWDLNLRTFLRQLPRDTQQQIAYRSAWKLLFGDEFA